MTPTPMRGERYVDAAGIRTRVVDEGEGPAVVFIHGGNLGSRGGCISAENWNLNWPYFARRHRAIAFDRLGQGMTDLPGNDSDYTMGASVAHAIATLEALGAGRAHLVGHSRGAYIAAWVAVARPDLAASLTIANTGTLAPGVEDNHIVLEAVPRPLLGRASQRWLFERSSFDPRAVDAAWLDEGESLALLAKNQLALAKMEGGLYQTVFHPELAAGKARLLRHLAAHGMHCPTLVVWGRNDPLAGAENGLMLYRLLAARRPDAVRYALVNRAGHFVFKEQPGVFNRVVESFVGRACRQP